MMSSVIVWVWRAAGRAVARLARTIGRMVVSCILNYEIRILLGRKEKNYVLNQ